MWVCYDDFAIGWLGFEVCSVCENRNECYNDEMCSKIAIYKHLWCTFSYLFYNISDLSLKQLRCSFKTRIFKFIVVILIADVRFPALFSI